MSALTRVVIVMSLAGLAGSAAIAADSGYPVVGGTWVGLLAPAKTPEDVVNKLSRESAAVIARADIRDRFVQLGIDPVGSTPGEFMKFLQDEVAKCAKVIKDANVKIEN